MQFDTFEKKFNDLSRHDKALRLNNVFAWIQSHTELCHLYSQESVIEIKAKFKEEIDISMSIGKKLIEDCIADFEKDLKKPCIPLSGKSRFAQPSGPVREGVSLTQKDVVPQIKAPGIAMHSEFSTLKQSKRMPLPSRTYLKKK